MAEMPMTVIKPVLVGDPFIFLMFFEGILVRLDDIVRMDEVRDGEVQTKVFTKHAGYFLTAEPLDGIVDRMRDALSMAGER